MISLLVGVSSTDSLFDGVSGVESSLGVASVIGVAGFVISAEI
jgi:hypothetical protein